MYEPYLVSGNVYKATLDITSGAVDLAMFGYEASRSSGDRGNHNWVANDYGSGVDEEETFLANSTGPHGIAVVNDDAGMGDYSITVVLIPEPGMLLWFLVFGFLSRLKRK